MLVMTIIVLGGLALTAGVAAFAKQSLIEDARSATKGYF
ncbi:hypothetical protein GGR33_004182 [Methylobacterium brachythecii]|uniref:Uncharacterized protein n=1 Tax=Methylobacterium brachythecii TaxID=1176177 RepID=A0A7W6AMR1_9HYPH|nr:hypothetical protein [Methylobacterium brachythecii]